jgi:hypothetical protein
MKPKQFIALIIAFAIATAFVLGLQPFLFYQPIIPFSMTMNELEEWLGAVLWPITWTLYGLGVVVLFIWIWKATTSKFTRATEVLSTQGFWWLLLIIYVVLGIGIFLAIAFFNGWMDGSRSFEPLFWFPPFVFLDGILLFWLPTAIATPRSMRYIPPLAMQLRKLYGG